MFLCVNANAAIDKTVVVRGFELDRIHRPEKVVMLPGGKGINLARGLQTLGETSLVTGWAGGFAGKFIAAGLQAEGIQAEFAWCEFESRTCLSILDPERGTLTELYESGEPVPAAKVEELKEIVARRIRNVEFVTISGRLSTGVPDGFYAGLVQIARQAGVPAALDCSGEPLRLGLEQGRPALIKPNQSEFQALWGHPLEGLAEFAAAARQVAARWDTLVVLSLGANGAVAARPDEVWHAIPPQVQVASPVGSGDALLAGMVQGLTRGLALPDALRRGVAAGTANALTVGAGRFSREDFERILVEVRVRKVQ